MFVAGNSLLRLKLHNRPSQRFFSLGRFIVGGRGRESNQISFRFVGVCVRTSERAARRCFLQCWAAELGKVLIPARDCKHRGDFDRQLDMFVRVRTGGFMVDSLGH